MIAHKIFNYALNKAKNEKRFKNLSGLSSDSGVPLTGLWYNKDGRRKWTADNWLKVLDRLGAIDFYDEGILIALTSDQVREIMRDIEASDNP